MIKKMFPLHMYMFGSRERKEKRCLYIFYLFGLQKKKNVFFTFIPTLSRQVSKVSKGKIVLSKTFLSISTQFGRIENGGSSAFHFFSLSSISSNQTAEKQFLLSISFPFPPLPSIPNIVLAQLAHVANHEKAG